MFRSSFLLSTSVCYSYSVYILYSCHLGVQGLLSYCLLLSAILTVYIYYIAVILVFRSSFLLSTSVCYSYSVYILYSCHLGVQGLLSYFLLLSAILTVYVYYIATILVFRSSFLLSTSVCYSYCVYILYSCHLGGQVFFLTVYFCLLFLQCIYII